MLTPLESTLTSLASATHLTSTLTRPSRKNIKTRDFNPIRCHTYEGPLRKPCRINTYKKQGVGEGVPRISIFWFRRATCGHCCEAKLESTRQPTNLRVETLRLKGPE